MNIKKGDRVTLKEEHTCKCPICETLREEGAIFEGTEGDSLFAILRYDEGYRDRTLFVNYLKPMPIKSEAKAKIFEKYAV